MSRQNIIKKTMIKRNKRNATNNNNNDSNLTRKQLINVIILRRKYIHGNREKRKIHI